MTFHHKLALLSLGILAGPGSAFAATIFSDSFSGSSLSNKWGQVGGSNGAATFNTAVGNPPNSLAVLDSATGSFFGDGAPMSGYGTTFDTSNAATPTLQFRFDFEVTNMTTATGGTSTPRVTLVDNSSNDLTFGVGHASVNVGGNAADTVFFFVGAGSAPTPGAANAIGYNAAAGGSFATGFNLGTYAAGNSGTGGFYTIAGSVTGSNVAGTITDPSSHTANFSLTAFGGNFTNTNASANFFMISGTSYTGDQYLDNVELDVVPEPGSLALLGVAAAGLLARRRRHA